MTNDDIATLGGLLAIGGMLGGLAVYRGVEPVTVGWALLISSVLSAVTVGARP